MFFGKVEVAIIDVAINTGLFCVGRGLIKIIGIIIPNYIYFIKFKSFFPSGKER